MKLKNILLEKVYGNKATVYHRTPSANLLTSLIHDGFQHSSGMYGKGIYTTYEPTEKTNWRRTNLKTGDPEKDNSEGKDNYYAYGKYQVKFSVDLINFFIFDWEVYQEVKPHIAKVEKFTKQKSDQDNFINLQAEYFKLPHRINTPYRKRYTSELALEFGFKTKYSYSNNPLINGIVFFGSTDGNVLVCYNKAMIVPLSITNSDTTETINLQKLLNSDMKLKDEFKNYFKKFIRSKNNAMSNVKKSIVDIAKEMWDYDETTNMFSYKGDIKITENFIEDGKLLIKFDKVGGTFDFDELPITTLDGSPRVVGGDFKCYYTRIRSLEGAPEEVGGNFNCYACQLLTSAEGAPQTVRGDVIYLDCRSLESLVGSARIVGGSFNCSITRIRSLEGAPEEVGGDFKCSNTNILTLEGAPHTVGGDFECIRTSLKSLKGAPKEIGNTFNCYDSVGLKSLDYLPIAKKYFVPFHLTDELKRILR